MTTSLLTNDAISTDASFTGATNTAVPSQLAVKTYADTKQPLDAALTELAAGSDFVQFAGPTTTTKVFTLPDASGTLLFSGGPLGTPSSGVATNLTGTALGLIAANVTGIVALGNGGTGKNFSAVTDGQIPIGKTSDNSLNLATIIGGSNISVVNGAGAITISSTVSGGGATGRIYYPGNSVASDLTGYKVASTIPSANAQSDISIICPTANVNVFGQAFATASGEPNNLLLPSGTAVRFLFAKISGGIGQIQVDLFQYKTTGNVATTGAVSFTYAAAGKTITRAAGSFVTDGFTAGCKVTVAGTVNNNGTYTVQTVAALTLTLILSDVLVNETVSSTITTKEKRLRTGSSPDITSATTQLVQFFYTDSNSYALAADDRIIFKWWGRATSNNRTITISTEGFTAASYIQTTLPIALGVVTSGVWNATAIQTLYGGTGNTTGTATINANLTGPVTSTGNATAIADATLSIAKTSGLQAALDAKQPLATNLTSIGALANAAGILSNNGAGVFTYATAGAGTVTSVAALTLGTTGTDLSSTVATGTTTPVITLQVPTASAANRGALSAADWTVFSGKQAAYANLTTIGSLVNATGLLRNNGAGVFSYDATAYLTGTKVDSFNTRTGAVTLSSSDVTTALTFTPYNSTNPAGYTANLGTVTGVTATAPVASSGGTAPVISMVAATDLVPGHLTAADHAAFAAKQPALGFTPINKAGDTGIGALTMGALTATSATLNGGSNSSQPELVIYSNTGTDPRGNFTIFGSTNATNYQGSKASKAVLYSAYCDIVLNADTGNQIEMWTGSANRFTIAASGAATFASSVSMGALTATTATTSVYAVASLPAGAIGMTAMVNNALAPTYGAAVVGGGAIVTKVFHNGTTWVVG